MGNVYGFVDRDPQNTITASEFMVRYTRVLEDILDDPNARILISDQPGSGIFVSRYLKEHYYRNAVLYHTGERPRVNLASIPTKSFTSPSKVKEGIMTDATEVIEV